MNSQMISLVDLRMQDSLPASLRTSAHNATHEPMELPALAGARKQPSMDDHLVAEYLPVVRFIARRLHERMPRHVELDDLVSAGVVGLIDAASKFDGKKQVQFKSYAQFRIRGAILDFLRTQDWSPRDLRRKGRKVEEAVRELSARLGRSPSEAEIATSLGLTLDGYQQLTGDLKGLEIGSLNVQRDEGSGEEELACLPCSPAQDPLFLCMQGEMRAHLIAAIDTLPEKERLVLTLYYYEELTMKEIALTLGVVESRVSQIRARAIGRLRKVLGPARAAGAKKGNGSQPVKAGNYCVA